MIDLADGTIVNVQQDIQVNLKLREDAGFFYINFYQVNGTEEEWIYGDEIYRSSAQHYFLIPANLFTDANYRIDVDAWIGTGGHNDEMITRESVYFHTVTDE